MDITIYCEYLTVDTFVDQHADSINLYRGTPITTIGYSKLQFISMIYDRVSLYSLETIAKSCFASNYTHNL